MDAGQAVLAALPPALAIYFELINPRSERRIYDNAYKKIETLGIGDTGSGRLPRVITNFTIGTMSVFSFRPTIVSVISTSFAILYELHGNFAFFGAVGIAVVLMLMLPIFINLESFRL